MIWLWMFFGCFNFGYAVSHPASKKGETYMVALGLLIVTLIGPVFTIMLFGARFCGYRVRDTEKS